jgi:hypothetical protein
MKLKGYVKKQVSGFRWRGTSKIIVKISELACGHHHIGTTEKAKIKEERGKAVVSLVDLIVGDIEF